MNFNTIRDAMRDFLLKQTMKLIDVATLRSAFSVVLEPLRKKTKGTENEFDDWVVEAIFAILADDAKMQKLVDFLQSKLTEGMCVSVCDSAEYETLAAELGTTPGICEGSATWFAILTKVLETVLPVIIDWVNEKKEA